jgi:ADP-heptose:LPS heptosyltransferase
MRLTRWAKEKSQATVVLEINPQTASLARRMGGFDVLTLHGELPPPFDFHVEMMSLPMALGLKLPDLPGEPMPYLTPDPERLERWRKRLKDIKGPKVCLVWAGRPTHLNDANRSITLDMLKPLAEAEVTFLSIQKGPTEDQAADPPDGMKLVNLSPEIADFEDTAAILSAADLLISVDSSPVHLAGALGRPAWVMLPFSPDWRWLMNRDDTPWYPSVRLFRQTSPGDWPGVIQRAAEALKSWSPGV